MTTKEKVDWRVIVAGMACLAAIEIVALCKGINGTLMVIVTAAIAGLAGYVLPSPIKTT